MRLFRRDASWVARPGERVSTGQGNNFRRLSPHFAPRFWKGGALRAAEKLESAVILSIDSRLAAHDRRKLGPRKGSADLFVRSAAFPCPSGTCRGPKKQVRATPVIDERAADLHNSSEQPCSIARRKGRPHEAEETRTAKARRSAPLAKHYPLATNHCFRQGRSDQGSSPCSRQLRSPSQTPPSSRHRHRLPRGLGAGSWNRRRGQRQCPST